MQLADGVHALAQTIDRGDRTVTINPAAVETDRGVLLLDVGFAGELDQVADGLADLGYGLADVWGVVLSHQDGDHAGALAELVAAADPVVFAHEECAPVVDGRMDPIKGEGDRYDTVDVDVELTGGERFRTHAGPMAAVFTPGHAPGHLSFAFPEARVLVAADALTAPESSLAGPNEEFTLDMPEAVESVGKLADYDVERTLCYHGGIVDEGTGAIARLWTELAD